MKKKTLSVRVDPDFSRRLNMRLAEMGLHFQPVAMELLKSWIDSDINSPDGGGIPVQPPPESAYNIRQGNAKWVRILDEVLSSGHEVAVRAIKSNLEAFQELIHRAGVAEFYEAAAVIDSIKREQGGKDEASSADNEGKAGRGRKASGGIGKKRAG